MTENNPKVIMSRDQARELGLKRYSSTVQCKYGHLDERLVRTDRCVTCEHAKDKKRYKPIRVGVIKDEQAAAKKLGLKYYMTKIPCPNGHMDERSANTGECAVCTRARSRAAIKIKRDENPEFYKQKHEEWAVKNPEKLKACSDAYRRNNREKINLKARAYYREHPEEKRKISSDWRNKNPEKVKVQAHRRRARMEKVGGWHTASEIRELFLKQHKKCAFCFIVISRNGDIKTSYHVDHIKPFCRGGTNNIDNIQLLCPSCNLRKHAKDPFDWAKQNGRLL